MTTIRGRCAAALLLTAAALASVPALPPHPRLILTDARVSELVSLVTTSPAAATLHAAVLAHGNICIASPTAYGVGGLLDSATTLGLLHRMNCSARGVPSGEPCATPWGAALAPALVRVASAADYCGDCVGGNCTGMGPYVQRFASLCFAALGQALAVGYDWLFDSLTLDERSAIERGITNQVLDVYAEGLQAAFASGYWFESNDNFHAAINSGALLAALAVGGLAPPPGAGAPLNNTAAFADDVYDLALVSLRRAFAEAVDPVDGSGYIMSEGPTYYAFGLSNLLPALDGLATATGSDGGLRLPAAAAGRYLMDLVGPSRLFANWADTAACANATAGCDLAVGFEDHWALGAFARRSGDPALAVAARDWAAGVPRDGVWYAPSHPSYLGTRMLMDWSDAGEPGDLDALPLGAAHYGARLAFLRSSWRAPDAAWACLKGGDNHLVQLRKATTHMHADAGAVMLELGGARLAFDLGSDNYLLPGYFGLKKWRYYRTSTAGHNTLTFGGRGQDECTVVPSDPAGACAAPVDGFALVNASSGDGWARVDLSGVYGGSGLGAAARGLALVTAAGRGAGAAGRVVADGFLLRDEWAVRAGGGAPPNVSWALHTFAAVAVTGPLSATLTAARPAGGAPVLASLVADGTACPGLALAVRPVVIPPPGNPAPPGLVVVTLTAPDAAACASLTVLVGGVAPGPGAAAAARRVLDAARPLAAWDAASGPWAVA